MKIKTEKLGKKFNRDWIFRNLTVEFSEHIYAITGPNGSGKSTLLQVLWSQMPASTGSVQYSDATGIIPSSEVYQKLSIATPYMDLIDEFTLAEAVNFHFKFKQPRNGFSTQEVIERLELAGATDKTIGKFSSGMKQRTKLGLAFFTQADLMFLDEPGTNLDKASFEWYWQNLMALPQETLVIIASNQEQEYPPACTKINILDFK